MTVQQIALLALSAYFFVILGIAYFSSRRETDSDFLIGSRQIGLLGTVASMIAGFRDGTGLVFWVFVAAVMGFGGIWMGFGVMAVMLILAWQAPNIYQLAKKEKFLTVSDFLEKKVGGLTAKTASILVLFFAALYAALQLFIAGKIFSQVLDFDFVLTTVSVAAVVGVYLIVGGYKTLIKTDILQWVILMSLIVMPFLIGFDGSEIQPMQEIFVGNWEMKIVLFFVGFLAFVSMPDTWQRIFSARDPQTARRALLISGPTFTLLIAGTLLFGYTVYQLVGGDPNTAFFGLFEGEILPSWLTAILGVLIAAIIMSTLDTQIFVLASTIAKDFLPQRSDAKMEKLIKILIGASLAILTLIAIFIGDVIEFISGIASVLFVLAPILLLVISFSVTKKESLDRLVSLGMALSAALFVYMFFAGYFEDFKMIVVPSAAFAIYLLLVIFARKFLKT